MPHADERRTLERLGEEISKHYISGAILNTHLLAANIVGNKKITDVNVLGVLCAGAFAIGFKKDTTLVVLIDNVVVNVVAMGSEKQTRPEDETDGIIDAN